MAMLLLSIIFNRLYLKRVDTLEHGIKWRKGTGMQPCRAIGRADEWCIDIIVILTYSDEATGTFVGSNACLFPEPFVQIVQSWRKMWDNRWRKNPSDFKPMLLHWGLYVACVRTGLNTCGPDIRGSSGSTGGHCSRARIHLHAWSS